MEGLGLGLSLVFFGLVAMLLVWVLLRLLTGTQSDARISLSSLEHINDVDQKDAVIIVQIGGRVEYVNKPAYQLFGLRTDEQVDLDRLARYTRPTNDFFSLFSKECQKRISVGSQLAEATSYRIPGLSPLMMVVFRGIDLVPVLSTEADGQVFTSTLRVITDFIESISSSLNQEATLQAILENVGRLISTDTLELKIWNESHQKLVPYRLETRTGDTQTVQQVDLSYFSEYSQSLCENRKPQLIANATAGKNEHGYTESYSLRSYIGIPLLDGEKLIGTLEAGLSTENGFNQYDVELLSLVSNQIAVAIHNALLFEEEQSRTIELTGLANLAQAISVSQDMKDLFERLVKSISPLFNVEILGFLLFDEGKRTLEGQVPFQGLPTHIVEIYRTNISTENFAPDVINDQKPILTLNAAEDDIWASLGIQNLAKAASLRDSALIPLFSSRRLIGFLQLSNHKQGVVAFSDEELRLMHIVASQATAIIENAVLVQQARQRAYRSDALRRIASLAASFASVDEVLEHSVRELAHLFQADTSMIFLLDEQSGELRLHDGSIYGFERDAAEAISRMFVADAQFHQTVSGSRESFISGRLSSDRRVLPVYRPIVSTLRVESAMVVPLVVREHSLGELMLGSRKSEFFNSYDLQVVTTAAGQLASALDSAQLVNQTDESLRARVDQLTVVMRVSRELNASLEIESLLSLVHDELLRVTHADCGTILLFEPTSTSELPDIRLSRGCPVNANLSLILERLGDMDEPLVIENFDQEDIVAPHEDARSALFAPIRNNGKLAGVIYLHASQPAFFSRDLVDLLQTLAVQTSIAINTASQYQVEHERAELSRHRANAISGLTEINHGINFEHPLEQQLRSIGNVIREATPFQTVLFSVYEPDTDLLRRVTGVGFPQDVLSELLSRKQPLASVRQLLKKEFRVSRSYFIPADQTPVVPADVHMVTLDLNGNGHKENAWDPDDFLLVLLEDAQGEPLGLLSLDAPKDGLRPDKATIETVEVFAAQAALVISNTIRFNALRSRVETLSSGLQRQQRLLSVTQNDLPFLLSKDLDQTLSIHNLEQRAQRVRAGLAITESVSRQLDGPSALLALGREVLTQLEMSVALVAENSPEGPRLLHIMGNVPRATNPETLFGQRNPLRTCLQTGEPILFANEDETDEWHDTPLLNGLRAKAFICLPVTVQGRVVAAILATSPEPLQMFTDEDRQVYHQIARQTSVILQNISLLNETRRRLQEVDLLLDFSRQISGLTPDGIVSALLESARRVLQSAHAGVVLLWDENTAQLVPRICAGYADNDSLMKISYRAGEALPGKVLSSQMPLRVDELNFARDYTLSAESLFLFRQATGGRLPVSTLLIPIVASGQSLGVIGLDNFNTQAAFKPEDETLLLSLTQQVALSLENVRLVHATRERAGQLQALNEVATSLTSSLRSDALVENLLDQLHPVLPFATATLLLRADNQLRVVAAKGFVDKEQRLGLTVNVKDSALFQEMIRLGQPISVADVRQDERFPQIDAPCLSWLGIPLISKGEVIGVITLEKWQANFYTPNHIQVATTFAGQAAVALENARLYEDSINRAAELDQRSQRLALLNRFSSELSGLLNADEIQHVTAEELRKAFAAMRVSVVLVGDKTADWILTTPERNDNLPQALPYAPVFDQLRESHGVFASEDFLEEPLLSSLHPMLGKQTTSVLALPLMSGGNRFSILFIQLPTKEHLSTPEIELALTIANQASVALDSARLYQEAQRRAQETAALAEVGREVSATLNLEDVLQRIADYAQELLQAETSAVYIPDEEDEKLLRGIAVVGEDFEEIKNEPLAIGEGILGIIAARQEGEIVNNAEHDPRARYIAGTQESIHEHIMSVPVLSKHHLSGLMAVWRTGKGLEFDNSELEFLKSLSQQAAVAIENARLFAETQRLAEELEQRVVERTAELENEKASTETLLRILSEVSASLDLDRALSRTLALLNDAVGGEQGTIMLLHAEDNMLHYRAGYGYLTDREPNENRGFALKIGEGLAGWVVEQRKATLIDDLHKDERWVRAGSRGSNSGGHRSSIVAPLQVGEDVIGVLMVFHRKVGFFGPERLGLVQAIGSQVAIAINNAHLYELIRDQAERLGSMLRKEQEEASRSQAILEAVADGVVVTGSDNRITFLNSPAAEILNLEAEPVIEKSLDAFGDVFGKAAFTWMQTINDWSNDPASFEIGDSYAEQIELEDGRIALVHLAPVILQNDFLGTVSIFRDITHEVEVDKLKSEFVATVSHELRTPMTSIRGYVDILLMGAAGALNENQLHFLNIVKNNTERLNILVNDLLDISRIEAGRVTLSPQPLDLRGIAEDVLADVLRRSHDERKPMAFSLDAHKKLPRVFGDAERVRQVLGNLVDNAYHYTPENGQITVHIHTLNGSEVQVDVEDSGVGISKEDQERIFDRFYRGEDPLVLATPGTGLGLAIVSQLVQMHNGRIWLTSEGVGKGSTFSFTLPIEIKDE